MSDPDDPDTVGENPNAPAKPGMWQRPLVRGAANGVIFAVMLCIIQVLGLFGPERPLDDESIAGNIVAGVVFGFVMYIIELWRAQRRSKQGGGDRTAAAAEAASKTVEARPRDRESEDGDGTR